MKFKNILAAGLLLLYAVCLIPANGFCRQGCCSHHGGVCGGSCCDGTPLSPACGGSGSGSTYSSPSGGSSSGSGSAYSTKPVKPNPRMSSALTKPEMNRIILDDVLTFCPQNMQQYLLPHRNGILEGFNFSARVKRASSAGEAGETYEKLLAKLKAGNVDDVALKSFGMLADTILTAVYPGAVCYSSNHLPLLIRYDGYQDIPDMAARIRDLKIKYQMPCRDNDTKRIEGLYNVALNEIVNCWLSAWTRAGYAAQPYVAGTVFQHPAEIK